MPLLSSLGAASARGFGALNQIASAIDEYFKNVTLLLPGNGTNGAQNNTFLDSSSNNFSITRNGDTTQGTFSPFSPTGWSNYFNGSSAYINYGRPAGLDLGSADWTFECWTYLTSTSFSGNIGTIFGSLFYDNGFGAYAFWIQSNSFVIYIRYAGNNLLQINYSSVPASVMLNVWRHIAITRSGSDIRLFLDGVQQGTTNTTIGGYSIDAAYAVEGYATPYTTGAMQARGYIAGYFPGYISNLRLTKNAALYTSNFTPPTLPLTTTVPSGTVALLTCQNNRFLDNSSNGYTVTVTGLPSVQAFSPFLPTAAYSALTNGGSGYFDGSGDYIQTQTSAILGMGSGDFTVEGWYYVTNTTDYRYLFDLRIDGANTNTFGAYLNTGTMNLLVFVGPSGDIASGSLTLNSWNHVAVVRSGSTVTTYINGVASGTPISSSQNLSDATYLTLGRRYTVAQYYTGYISCFRMVKGTALYTSNFTPPTTPPTAITNTSLLLNFTNAGIIDNTAKNDLVTVGNAQISTTQSKFGGASMYFDGTGDWLTAPSGPITSLEGNFTVEGWVYLSSTAAAWPVFTVGDSSGASGIELYRATSNGKWRVYQNNTAQIDSSTSTSTGSWVHLAVVRSSGSVKLYVDGVNEGSAWSTTQSFSGAVYVGAEFNNGSVTVSANGYIDDLRITKGIARYTANFTPPAAAFPLR